MKIFFSCLLFALMVFSGGYGVYSYFHSKVVMSEIMLANIEALADWENTTFFRVHPCPDSPATECKWSNDTYRNECFTLTYCP